MSTILLLVFVGRFLLEHCGVDDLTPLPAICSETPGRVNANAEGLDVPGHGPQPCITRKSSRSSPSCRRVAHCSYHDSVVVFLIWSSSQVAKKVEAFSCAPTWRQRSSLWYFSLRHLWHGVCMEFEVFSSGTTCQRHLFCLRVAWSLSRCHNSTVGRAVCKPCRDKLLCWQRSLTFKYGGPKLV